ncbi:hypothetical protein [Sinimarinibacterium sp. NLF-5-8]|uniref:hypothetical protein n=1 Tax=Sinimarinibacterium sp. NLF-5-8 TaxID=2698684 RepID=UPI00137BB45B|nr:hypothetical protein [Sinimarinibacterium sp. NLF-5-8]QHS09217.1 hypothetical protein GT972_02950 [Sinimarinibacterium sp. NLF-5-8]
MLWLSLLIGLLLIALCVTLWLFQRQRRRLDALEREQHALQSAWQLLPAHAARLLPPRTLISIEILNPLELAQKQTILAAPVGQIAPALIHKIVYRRALEMVHQQLAQHGAKAEVRLHELD